MTVREERDENLKVATLKKPVSVDKKEISIEGKFQNKI